MGTELNTELFFLAADAVEAAGENFDQSMWTNDRNKCETPSCIGGYVAFLTLKDGERLFGGDVHSAAQGYIHSIRERAQKELGLNNGQAWTLFHQYPGLAWPFPWNNRWKGAVGDTDQETRRLEAKVAADFLRAIAREEARLPDFMV